MPPGEAVGIEVTAVATDLSYGGMLGQPGGDGRGRAVRQQVHHPMTGQIDQDGAIAMAPPPGPLIDADSLQSWRRGTGVSAPGGWSRWWGAAGER